MYQVNETISMVSKVCRIADISSGDLMIKL